jgi:hypothetical protein
MVRPRLLLRRPQKMSRHKIDSMEATRVIFAMSLAVSYRKKRDGPLP